jgi:hypothetical protein
MSQPGRRRNLAWRLRAALRLAWRRLREWSGDLAYETYASRGGDSPRLSRRAFYLASLQRRYQRPNRCC